MKSYCMVYKIRNTNLADRLLRIITEPLALHTPRSRRPAPYRKINSVICANCLRDSCFYADWYNTYLMKDEHVVDTSLIEQRLMELAQLLITPGTLLTAFIFFWKQAKTGRDELRRELKEEIGAVRNEVASIRIEMHDMNGRLGRVEGLLRATDSG